jgi:hypothetical protein
VTDEGVDYEGVNVCMSIVVISVWRWVGTCESPIVSSCRWQPGLRSAKGFWRSSGGAIHYTEGSLAERCIIDGALAV